MRGPLVSIVITAYNYGHMLETALASACAQEYEALDILVLDDCSTDDTADVVARFASDARVRYLRNESNLGVGGNTNKGLREARGEYITYLSADDKLMPNFVSTVMQYLLDHPLVDLAYTEIFDMSASGREMIAREVTIPCAYERFENEFATILMTGCYICFASLIVPRRIYEEYGGFDESVTASDFDLLLRWTSAGVRFGHITEPLVAVRHHDGQLSTPGSYLRSGRDLREYVSIAQRYMTAEHLPKIRGFEVSIARIIMWKYDATIQHGFHDDGALKAEVDAVCGRLEEIRIAHEAQPFKARISVCVLANGSMSDLEKSVRSLDAQTYTGWEALLIGDRDDVEDIAVPFEARARCRMVVPLHEESEAGRFNLALSVANGNCYAFLRAGNAFAPDHLEHIAAAFERGAGDVIVCGATVHGEGDATMTLGGHAVDTGALVVAPLYLVDGFALKRTVVDIHRRFPDESAALYVWRYLLWLVWHRCRVAGLSTSRVLVDLASVAAHDPWLPSDLIAQVTATHQLFPVGDPAIIEQRTRYLARLSASGDILTRKHPSATEFREAFTLLYNCETPSAAIGP